MGTLRYLKRCVCLLSALFASINSEKDHYTVYPLESDTVCSLKYRISPNFIDVGIDENSGVIIEETEYFNSLSGKYPFNCQFKIRTIGDGMGLFAVIQTMRLRRNKTTGECIDYVQFRHTHTYQLGPLSLELEKDAPASWGEKYCGNINTKEVNFSVHYPINQLRVLPQAYVEREGKMDVLIYVASGYPIRKKELELRIAFTAYYICNNAPSNKTYRTCGEDSCIFHKYFADGILNCPFTTCLDENGCQIFYEAGLRPGTGLATKVMVGAVAGVFTMFVVFVVFLWLFRHCSLCWSDTGSNLQNTTQMRPVPTVEDVQPSAPSRTPSIDKDLPPSYESLFPST